MERATIRRQGILIRRLATRRFTPTPPVSDNTANGYEALYNNTVDYNTATGSDALYSNTTGYGNTASGLGALYKNTTGDNNTASGLSALYNNTTGNYNTASGTDALYNNTTGDYNMASGSVVVEDIRALLRVVVARGVVVESTQCRWPCCCRRWCSCREHPARRIANSGGVAVEHVDPVPCVVNGVVVKSAS